MDEEVAATPGWVEERLDQLWAETKIDASEAPAMAARSLYLNCLAGCSPDNTGDSENCQDVCRQQLLESLRQAGVGAEALAALEQRLESLEAEITDATLPSSSK